MKAGIYYGKALSVGISESKEKKTLSVAVNIQIFNPSQETKVTEGFLTWNGWLSEKAIDTTKKALGVMGFVSDDFAPLAEGKGLDFTKEFQVDIEEDVDPTSGKIYPKVKWINEKGGSKAQIMDVNSALMRLNTLGLTKKGKTADSEIPF